jgi:UDP-N-acetyl-D-mannosaminuronic acid transferase (WecB/TagA/CpsF family)
MKRISFLDCPMDISTMEGTVSSIENRIVAEEFTQHVVVNVAKLVNMQSDLALTESVKACDIINIDVTLLKDAYHGDTSKTFIVGKGSVLAERLIQVKKKKNKFNTTCNFTFNFWCSIFLGNGFMVSLVL